MPAQVHLHTTFACFGPRVATLPTMEPSRDEPLPATMLFVSGLGIFIFIGWFGMYVLLRSRW